MARPSTVSSNCSDYMVDVMKSLGGGAPMELITCNHEEISVAMAHGYYKIEGKPMACMIHTAVGLQHGSMAIYNA